MYKFILDSKLTINILLVIFLSISYFVWNTTNNYDTYVYENAFKAGVVKINENVEKRMLVYENALRSGLSFYNSSEYVTRKEWKKFVENLQIKELYPGIQGIGITLMLKAKEIKPLESLMQREGYPDFKLKPAGKRDQYSAIIYLEPLDKRNMAAIGYDMFSQSTRRKAMEIARDTGLPTISSRVTLMQEIDSDVQAGVLMYLPLYEKSLPSHTTENRPKVLIGYVYGVFRMDDLIRPALDKESMVLFELYDGEKVEKNLLMRSHKDFLNLGKLTMSQGLKVGGRQWNIHAYSTQELDKKMQNHTPTILGILGIFISFIFYGVLLTLYNSRKSLTQRTKELEEEKGRFTLAIEGSNDGLWDWNLQTNELIFGDRFETMLGYLPGTLENSVTTWLDLLHPDDKEFVQKVVQNYLNKKGKDIYESSFRLQAKDGSWKWILGRGKAEFDKDGKALRFVGFNTDITEQKEYQSKLEHTAKHDSLTQLPNRFLLTEVLTHAMSIAKRHNNQLALLFVDLDGFKEVNDTYGHGAGDEVLSTVASRMRAIVRASDIVSRIGGDEFVIVITDLNKSEEIIPFLQRLLSDLSSNIKYNKESLNISASIGVSFYPQKADIGNEVLIRQADQAMYTAKSAGKNQYKFFNIEASHALKENQDKILSLREAIKTNQLVLYYQPKVDMKNNVVVGLEALVRWKHPEKGLLFPDEFLPLIEDDSILMNELGKWVFKNAFSQLESWHLCGLDIMLNINVSAHEVQQEGFSFYLKKLLDEHLGIKANTIEIELLETAAFNNDEFTSSTLKECQKLGVSVAVDDFGTGYASLNSLKQLPINTIKIDRSFVIDLLYSSTSASIIEASIGLAHAFNASVVAEGVESEEHGKVLLQLGCTLAQGNVIAKAMPAQNIMKWIESYKGFSSWSTVKPLNDRERTILYTSIEHRNWIYSLRDFMQDKRTDSSTLNELSSYLGRWIDKCTSEQNYPDLEYEALQALHSKLYKYAQELLLSKENDTLKGTTKLRNLSQEILEKLESLARGR